MKVFIKNIKVWSTGRIVSVGNGLVFIVKIWKIVAHCLGVFGHTVGCIVGVSNCVVAANAHKCYLARLVICYDSHDFGVDVEDIRTVVAEEHHHRCPVANGYVLEAHVFPSRWFGQFKVRGSGTQRKHIGFGVGQLFKMINNARLRTSCYGG